MKLIDKFYCIQKEILANGSENILSEGVCEIKQELILPEIFIDNHSLFKDAKKQTSKLLTFNPEGNFKLTFTEEELISLSKIFNFEIIQKESGYKLARIVDNQKFTIPTITRILTQFEKEIVLIKSVRWQFDYQPRGAGEDARGEDVTYIYGIWENPELPESIMKKIKGEI
jgi:hypothetical protein